MNNFGVPPVELVSGQGAVVTDADGKQYLDLLGGIAVNALGHAHPAIVQAVSEQVATLGHVSNFFTHPTVLALAERLLDISGARRDRPGDLLQLRRRGQRGRVQDGPAHRPAADDRRRGRLPRPHHGRAGADRPAGQAGAVRADAAPGWNSFPTATSTALRAAVDDTVAAVFLEPILGEAGVMPAPDGYLVAAREITAEHGALLVIDEVQTGIGRTGTWFAHQRAGIVPDIITLAKGLGGGLPIGAAIGIGDAANLLQPGQHGSTFAGNPVCAAAALAVLRTIETDGLLDHVDALGKHIATAVEDLGHPLVDHVRGAGLLLGIVLTEDVGPAAAARRPARPGSSSTRRPRTCSGWRRR